MHFSLYTEHTSKNSTLSDLNLFSLSFTNAALKSDAKLFTFYVSRSSFLTVQIRSISKQQYLTLFGFLPHSDLYKLTCERRNRKEITEVNMELVAEKKSERREM